MNDKSIFSQIVDGSIPSHKVYEDDKTLAFMNIYPSRPGHVLVIPKNEIDHLDDLDDADYAAVMETVRKVMKRQKEVLGCKRSCLKVEGFEVPHAHVHAVPCDSAEDFVAPPTTDQPDHDELARLAEKLSF